MPSRELRAYLDATEHRKTREDLKLAVQLVEGPRIAIDCGCGAGSDIAFLRTQGFTVHAFDIEQCAIDRCRQRFAGDQNVHLERACFNTFSYPRASLIVADASLFFCREEDFQGVWGKIRESLLPGGVFTGSFLGRDDSMAQPTGTRSALWPEVLIADADRVQDWMQGLEVISLTEYRNAGHAPGGGAHQWHLFPVIARRPRD